MDQETQSIADPELLGDVMDLREAIEQAEAIQHIADIESNIKYKYNECIEALKDSFEKSDLDRARQWTISLKYYTKLQEELDNKKFRVR